MHAELAYLFRHALLRSGAYELQPPGERAQLHHLVLDIMERELLAPSELDSAAAELALHAARAADGADEATQQALARREIALLTRAADYSQRGQRYEDSIRHWGAVADHPRATAAEAQDASFGLAKALAWAGRTRDAVARLRGLMGRLDGMEAVDAQMTLAQALISLGETTEARELARKARHAAMEAGRADVRRKCEYVLLRCERVLGRWQEALAAVDPLFELSRQAGDAREQVSLLFFKASLLADLHRFEETLAASRAASDLAALHGLTTWRAFGLGGEGVALRDMGQPQAGLPLILEAAAMFRDSGDRRLESSFAGAAAAALTNLGRLGEAVDHALDAAAVAQESGNIREQHIALGVAGAAMLKSRRFAEAADMLARANALALSMHDHYQRARHLARLAVAKLAVGDAAGFDATCEEVGTLLAGTEPAAAADVMDEIEQLRDQLGLR